MDVRTYLEQQQIHPQLIHAVEEFRNQYPVEEKVKYRVTEPMMPFYGTEILEMGIAALLQKETSCSPVPSDRKKHPGREPLPGSSEDLPIIFLSMSNTRKRRSDRNRYL